MCKAMCWEVTDEVYVCDTNQYVKDVCRTVCVLIEIKSVTTISVA